MKLKKDSFKELQAKWYGKLKKEGFEDAEIDEDNLKLWSTRFFARHSIEQIQAKQAYYQMAENFLNDYKFETKRERIIWEYHSNGISVRDIVLVLRKVRIKTGRQTIWTTVKRLQKKMYDMYMLPKTPYHE